MGIINLNTNDIIGITNEPLSDRGISMTAVGVYHIYSYRKKKVPTATRITNADRRRYNTTSYKILTIVIINNYNYRIYYFYR